MPVTGGFSLLHLLFAAGLLMVLTGALLKLLNKRGRVK
jgi:hypothetical protein